MKKSWKTTTAGILGAVAVIAVAVQNHLEGRFVDWPVVFGTVMTGIGLFFARDNNVTSEDVGIK